MDDVIKLLDIEWTTDAAGNAIEHIRSERSVLCRQRSVTRSEYYQAAQNDLHPDYVFVLSTFRDYHGERQIRYIDWSGIEHRLHIIRTYRKDNDELEITAEERIEPSGEFDSE